MVVEVRHVLRQYRHKMAAVNDQYPVQQFAADSSDPSFDTHRPWTDAVVDHVGTREAAVIVGHSGAGRLLSVTLDRYIWLLGRIVGFIDCRLDWNLAHLLECLG